MAAAFSALSQAELKAAKEIVKHKLYFVVAKTLNPRANDTVGAHFFCIDQALLYGPFFTDFGPLNLGCTYRFCMMLKAKLKDPKLKDKVIYFYCSSKPQHKANAACLIGLFSVLYLNKSPADAYKPLKTLEPYLPFRDASMGPVSFRLTIPHVLAGVAKALKFKFFDFTTFNVEEYEYFECVENGDLNIIVPGRFLAFSGPHASKVGEDGFPALTPEDYVPVFKKYGVSTIVRLNKKCYERERFTAHGFQHYDLFFNDGTPPPPDITEKFLNICETHAGTVAIHCKAGLGRTGSLIGCYLLKHHHFTAAEAIAWIRVCRPGSIIGPQQQFLKQQEARLWKAGGKPGTASGGGSSTPSSANGSAQTTPEKVSGSATAAGLAAGAPMTVDGKLDGEVTGRIANLSLEPNPLPGATAAVTPQSHRTSVSGTNGAAAAQRSPAAAVAGGQVAYMSAAGVPFAAAPYQPSTGFKGSVSKTTPPKSVGTTGKTTPKGSSAVTPPSAQRKSIGGTGNGSGSARGVPSVSSPNSSGSGSGAGKLVNSYMPSGAAGTRSPATTSGAASIKRSPPSAISTASYASPAPMYKSGSGAATASLGGRASLSPSSAASSSVAAMSVSQPLAAYANTQAQLAASSNTSAPNSPNLGLAPATVAAAYGVSGSPVRHGGSVSIPANKGRVPRRSIGTTKATY